MILVFFSVGGELQIDAYNNAQIFNRNGFIEVKEGNNLLASYNPACFIKAQKIRPQDPRVTKPVIPDPQGGAKTAEGEPKAAVEDAKVASNDNPETVHPGDRPEGQQDSPDRGSAG